MGNFIGKEAITRIAENLRTNILMGPAYFSADELKRLGFSVTTGVQFKDVRYVLNRKGGTARRKVVGEEVNSQVGYLEEREMTARLVWDHWTDNEDNYVETPFPVKGTANFAYPFAEQAIEAAGKNFSDNVFACLFFGDEELTDKSMNMYDGIHTYLRHDIEAGRISIANRNLIPCEAVDMPSDTHDTAAWDIATAWQLKWSPALKRVKVLWYLSLHDSLAISRAYANASHGNEKVKYDGDGNWSVPELPNVTFVPSGDFGGENTSRWVVTIPGNFEFGVNTTDSKADFSVKFGSDKDNKDIKWQVQGIFGVRVLSVIPAHFVMNDGTVESDIWRGDYEKATFNAVPNNADYGTVTVTGGNETEEGYPAGQTLTITAEAKTGYKFVKWSNGVETAETSIVTKGIPDGIMAYFEKTTT